MFGEDIEALIDGSEILHAFYGDAWPCFHDAEIVEVHLWRGHLYPGDWDDRNVFPILTLKVLILEATHGATGSGNDLLVTLRFYDVDNVRLQDFNHNNSIVGFQISLRDRGSYTNGEPLPPSLLVTVEQGFGLCASFSCKRMEVITAGRPLLGP